MKHKIFKRILLLLLLVLAVIICFPVVFLIVGSLMGTDELNHYLGAVLGKPMVLLHGHCCRHIRPLKLMYSSFWIRRNSL